MSGFWELTVVGTISEATGSSLTYTIQKDFTAVLGLPIFTPGDVQTAQILARAFNILDAQLGAATILAACPAAGIALTNGQTTYAITGIPAQAGPPYPFRVDFTIENLIDSGPTVINAIVTAKTATSATLSFAPLPDSANFILRYAVYAK